MSAVCVVTLVKPVVRDGDQRAAVVVEQEVLQPVDRVKIGLGWSARRASALPACAALRQQHSDSAWPPCNSPLALVYLIEMSRALQQHGGVAFGGVATRRRSRLQARRGACHPRRSFRASRRCGPAPRVPPTTFTHDDGVDDAIGVEGKLVTGARPCCAGRTTVPFCRPGSPVRIFMNVDLPAPFGPVSL